MKFNITFFFCFCLPFVAFSQWSNNGNNYTTGKIGIGFSTPVYPLDISSSSPYLRIHNPDYSNEPATLVKKGGIIFNQQFSDKTAGIVFAVPNGYHVPGILFTTKTAYNQPGTGATDWYDRMFIHPNGNIGIGTTAPERKLHITGGEMILAAPSGTNSVIFTGIGASELNRYLALINSPGLSSASGLKAGGILVADQYNYADPGKNDLIVKGRIGIGTANPGSFKLAVEGKIGAREINVTVSNPWPDYVFETDYQLMPLSELGRYINERKHLPEVPTAEEIMESGIDVGQMNTILLKKIEELTLYILELKKENAIQDKKLEELQLAR